MSARTAARQRRIEVFEAALQEAGYDPRKVVATYEHPDGSGRFRRSTIDVKTLWRAVTLARMAVKGRRPPRCLRCFDLIATGQAAKSDIDCASTGPFQSDCGAWSKP